MQLVAVWTLGCTGLSKPSQGTPEGLTEEAAASVPRGPVQTQAPNASGQSPAAPGQTRAPQPDTATRWRQQDVASGLEHPWALEVLPDGRMLVTERAGRLRVVTPAGAVGEPIAGLPEVVARGQGGLLDVALAPDFPTSRRLFWSFAEPRPDGTNGTSVATGTWSADERSLEGVTVIFRQQPGWDSALHFGSRLVVAQDGNLFVTLGERSLPATRALAQDANTHLGKVVRIRPDGTVPADNPFVGRSDVRPEIWSLGHRNPQGATLDAAGRLWTVEHGPQGGDELNHPEAGKNYGWPVISYGQEYSGASIGEGLTAKEGLEQPVYYWDPVIAPSGMALYTGDRFPGWKGNFLVGGLVAGSVVRLVMDGDVVKHEEWLPVGARVRDVQQAPDGTVLVLTDEGNGRVVRLTPG
jgi:aldose sugar dehydrogenase